MSRHRMLFMVMALLFLLSFPLSLKAQDSVVPPQVGLRPDAPPYALHGPYWVGTQSMMFDNAGDPVEVRVWYPALNPNDVEPIITYKFGWWRYVLEGFDNTVVSDIYGHALDGGTLDLSAAPYPLVVMSPGFGGEPEIYAWMLEHIASYGFVVVSAPYNETWDPGLTLHHIGIIKRAQTTPRLIDFAGTLTAQGAVLAGMIDMERIAIAGQSSGGSTALTAAGARYDWVTMRAWCDSLAADDPDQALCYQAYHEEEMAQLAGLDSVPVGLWPAMGDARIDAMITMAGDAYMFGQDGLAAITMPILAMGGTQDTGTPYNLGVRPSYDDTGSQQKILVSFMEAEHEIWNPKCTEIPSVLDEIGSWAYFFCSDPVWDIDRAHDLANHVTTAYLLALLKDDADARAALATDAMSFPGIIYEAQGF